MRGHFDQHFDQAAVLQRGHWSIATGLHAQNIGVICASWQGRSPCMLAISQATLHQCMQCQELMFEEWDTFP
eukprot:scaffold35247_cov17-Tisochrysis_lutea.AAC.1